MAAIITSKDVKASSELERIEMSTIEYTRVEWYTILRYWNIKP